MPNQNNNKVNRRKFLSVSATGLAGATAIAVSTQPINSDAKSHEQKAPLSPPRTSIEITQYSVEWNPKTNKGRVAILLKDGEIETINFTSLNEAAGYAAILGQKNAVWWSDNSIGTIWQETGTITVTPKS